jgi:hypothetical protein
LPLTHSLINQVMHTRLGWCAGDSQAFSLRFAVVSQIGPVVTQVIAQVNEVLAESLESNNLDR